MSWSEAGEHLRHWVADVSLMHGWLPLTCQATALTAIVCATGLRSRRWWMRCMPVAVGVGVVVAAVVHWYLDWAGWTNDPTPPTLWGWLGLSGRPRYRCTELHPTVAVPFLTSPVSSTYADVLSGVENFGPAGCAGGPFTDGSVREPLVILGGWCARHP